MTAKAVDPRLRVAPPYIGWVPGTVNLLRSAPRVPVGPATSAASGSASSGGNAAAGKSGVGSGENWAAISGQA